ncbi:hypothetical protein [Phosphitispora fastidiosa]|uniref:hypothetical protein n=1 Tax=Phosphitispora fastidiosa TaxID=2837202 RepID=UPI001E48F830|nr:hypothetical protein [Phosphitispora fastidiosa]MBU7008325.1 hypothetical protein [Phosphitispora fastidiosa]
MTVSTCRIKAVCMDGFMVGISFMTGITGEIIICNSLLNKGVTAAMAGITGEIPGSNALHLC